MISVVFRVCFSCFVLVSRAFFLVFCLRVLCSRFVFALNFVIFVTFLIP